LLNATGSLVRVEVVGGDAPPCECAVAAGEHDTHLGYYPLGRDVAVELTDSAGRTTTIGDLGARLAAGSGVVPLDVSDASFPTVADRRGPARPASHVEALSARAVHPSPALSPLTETAMVRDGAAPDAQAATPESTAHAVTHAAPAKQKSKSSAKQADPPRDPLRGIFPRH
jgi:hypothetical protein